MEFKADNKYDATSVDVLYCPKCVQYAWNSTLLLRLKDTLDIEPGIWGIKFNKEVLSEQDKDFKGDGEYYIDLFTDKKVIFSFIKSSKDYDIVGLKAELNESEYNEIAKKDIEKDMRKKRNPKRIIKL